MPPKGGRSGSRSSSKSSGTRFGGTKHKSHGSLFGGRSIGFGFGSRSHSRPARNGHSFGGRHRFCSHNRARSGIGGASIFASRVFALPVPPGPFYAPGRISYHGTIENLRNQFSTIPPQDYSTIREITLCLAGRVAQEEGRCCKALVCLAGMMCLFPYFLNCCDCYRRQVEKLYVITLEEYQMLGQMLQRCQAAQHIKIFLQDNFLTQQKTSVLEGYLTALPLGMFTFSNCVMGLNLQNDQYDGFDGLFTGLKQSKWILVSLLWDDNFYLTKDYQPKQGMPMPTIPGFPMPGMPPTGIPGMSGMPPGPLNMMDSLREPLGTQQNVPFLNAYLNSDPFSLAMNQDALNSGMMMGGVVPPPNEITNLGMNNLMAQMNNPYPNQML